MKMTKPGDWLWDGFVGIEDLPLELGSLDAIARKEASDAEVQGIELEWTEVRNAIEDRIREELEEWPEGEDLELKAKLEALVR